MDSLAAQLEALTPFGMEKSTPLWFYILKDTEIMENGLRLGPVGERLSVLLRRRDSPAFECRLHQVWLYDSLSARRYPLTVRCLVDAAAGGHA